jgi:hypothetical protein
VPCLSNLILAKFLSHTPIDRCFPSRAAEGCRMPTTQTVSFHFIYLVSFGRVFCLGKWALAPAVRSELCGLKQSCTAVLNHESACSNDLSMSYTIVAEIFQRVFCPGAVSIRFNWFKCRCPSHVRNSSICCLFPRSPEHPKFKIASSTHVTVSSTFEGW